MNPERGNQTETASCLRQRRAAVGCTADFQRLTFPRCLFILTFLLSNSHGWENITRTGLIATLVAKMKNVGDLKQQIQEN